jgi:hypothetical protein
MTREFIDEHSFVDGQELYRKTYQVRTRQQTNSKALYFAQCSDPNETWLPLLEKVSFLLRGHAKCSSRFSMITLDLPTDFTHSSYHISTLTLVS